MEDCLGGYGVDFGLPASPPERVLGPGLSKGLVTALEDLGGLAGSDLGRRQIGQCRVKVPGVVPVDEAGEPGQHPPGT